jgi:hypothetical protein
LRKINKSTILETYQELPDEEFMRIDPNELSEEGKAAYEEEVVRRQNPNYIVKQAEKKKIAEDAEQKRIKSQAALRAYRVKIRRMALIGGGVAASLFLILRKFVLPDLFKDFPVSLSMNMAIYGFFSFVIWLVARVFIRPPKM